MGLVVALSSGLPLVVVAALVYALWLPIRDRQDLILRQTREIHTLVNSRLTAALRTNVALAEALALEHPDNPRLAEQAREARSELLAILPELSPAG